MWKLPKKVWHCSLSIELWHTKLASWISFWGGIKGENCKKKRQKSCEKLNIPKRKQMKIAILLWRSLNCSGISHLDGWHSGEYILLPPVVFSDLRHIWGESFPCSERFSLVTEVASPSNTKIPNSNRPFYSCGWVTWPMNGSEAAGDLVLIQTSLLFLQMQAS